MPLPSPGRRSPKKAAFPLPAALILAALAIIASAHPSTARRALRPLFIQVHITSPVSRISSADLRALLAGGPALPGSSGRRGARIFADSAIADGLRRAYPSLSVTTRSFADEGLMADRGFIGISDLRGLRPWFKAVYLDGALPWGRLGEDGSLEETGSYPFEMKEAEPWDPASHISIAQTGVTAMTRAFIRAVDRSGDVLSPVRYTRNITARADLAVTSSEVSFLEPCSWPLKDRMRFCSPLRFFSILEASGFDVIELTGNHNNDFGSRHAAASIDLMERAGMRWFGGGRDRGEAESTLYVGIKGRKIAFLGYNEPGPEYAFATGTTAGAARFSGASFQRSIAAAAGKADIVFVSTQSANENDPVPWESQKRRFHRAAELGATVIASSSAHRPMGIEFYRGRFISYGLGNFLFDQMQSINHRRGIIARHHFYNGRHVSTELIPYMIHDYSQPRPLSGAGARECLEEVFRHSIGPAFR